MPETERRAVTRAEAIGPMKAARLMEVSESTILRLIRAGSLPARKIGRQWRILISDLRKGTQK